ncbi:unnamed protein product, partial [Thlaspi arvense]
GCKAQEVAQKISSALGKLNYRGPISITAYGNMNHIPPSVKKALFSTGVVLNHVHVNSRQYRLHIFREVLYWEDPAPANLMLISRDEGLASTLSDQQSKGYNVLLAHPPNASDEFVSSAKTTWLWSSLLKEPLMSSQTCHNSHPNIGTTTEKTQAEASF